MAYIKAPVATDQPMYDYLEELRKSGDTNMFGASAYLEAEFDLDHNEARAILSDWMKGHSDPARKLSKNTTGKRSGRIVSTYESADD